MFCCEPIHAGYLREFSTRLPFCDHDCYDLYSNRWILKVRQPKRSLAIEDCCQLERERAPARNTCLGKKRKQCVAEYTWLANYSAG